MEKNIYYNIEEKEINELSVERVCNINKMLLIQLDHYLNNDDLYSKEDLFYTIKDLLIINNVLKDKVSILMKKINNKITLNEK